MTDRGRAWVLFGAMSVMYCFSMFFRVSTALIAVDLTREFRLSPSQLSLLGAAFFYSFALAQFPLGPALDRLGAKRIVVAATVVGAIGSLVFASGNHWWTLVLGRALMGLGMAPVLMGSLKLFSEWFAPGVFGTLSGLIMSLGGLGALLASTPLAGMVAWLGWRRTFVLFGVLTLVASAVVQALVRDHASRSETRRRPPPNGALDALRVVLRNRSLWRMAPLALVGYASVVSLQGLWAGPYLMDSLGYSRTEAGQILLGLAVAGSVGPVLAGYASDRIFPSRKWVVLGGFAPATLLMVPLLGVGSPSSALGWALLFTALGLLSGARILIYAHAKESVPPELAGTAVAAVNFFVMIGPALMQQAMGLALKAYPEDYAKAFLIPLLALVAGGLVYATARDTHPSR